MGDTFMSSIAEAKGGPGYGLQPTTWNGGVRLEPLANLAHELRTPLQVMLGYVDILRDEWAREFSSEPREILERIHLNAQELACTLGNLLELATAQAGGEAMVKEDIAVSDLVDDLTCVLETANKRKGLTLDFELDKAPRVIRSDRRLLRSILTNLALNAVKFTASGSVSIAVRRGYRNASECIEFEVRDTGPGIAPDQMNAAFAPFSQLSNTSSRKDRGLGLGLALVRHHIETLGASLELISDKGTGSSFIVRIFASNGAGTAAA